MLPVLSYGQHAKLDSLQHALEAAPEAAAATVAAWVAALEESPADSTSVAQGYYLLAQVQALADKGLLRRVHHLLGQMNTDTYAYDTAISHFQEAYALAVEAGDVRSQAEALAGKGDAASFNDQERKAVGTYQKALLCYQELEDEEQQATIAYYMGISLRRLGVVDSAGMYLEQARMMAERLELKALYVGILNVLGLLNEEKGNIVGALDLYQQALSVAEGMNLARRISALHNNIAILHKGQGDYAKAIEHYKKVVAINEAKGFDQIHLVQYNLGVVYAEMEDYQEAIPWLQRSLTNRQRLGLKSRQLAAAMMLAEVFEATGNPDSTDYYMGLGQALLPTIDRPRDQAFGYEQLAEINMHRGNFTLAEEQFLEARAIYQKTENIQNQSYIAEGLYELYQAMGDAKNALRYYQEHILFQDSLVNEEQIRALARKDEQYAYQQELIKKQSEIDLLDANQRIARLQYLTMAIALLVLLLVVFMAARQRIRRQKLQAEKLQEVSRFKEAMTGMVAHDLKNPLSVILNQSNPDAPAHHMAQQMLHLVSNMLDVHKMETTEVVPDTQALLLPSFVMRAANQVQPLVAEKNLKVNLDIPAEAVVQADPSLLYRVFINFLTNAIKFSPQNRTLTVSARAVVAGYQVSIRDEGVGIPEEQWESIFESFGQVEARKSGGIGSTGLGLTFCKLALAAHGTDIQIDSTVGVGTTFSFVLPKGEETVAAAAQKSSPTEDRLKIAREDWKELSVLLPQLKTLAVYEAVAIEAMLDKLRAEGQEETRRWVDSVLNAAYTG
ncbi:MAG TPA: hypothetical protein DCP28_11905, partial [Cytophagales bacterium]|nr:hypothetical protein [Cytophagales bacterium]